MAHSHETQSTHGLGGFPYATLCQVKNPANTQKLPFAHTNIKELPDGMAIDEQVICFKRYLNTQ